MAALLACGMATVAQPRVHAQQPAFLPEEGGMITLVGCLQRGGPHDKLILVGPRIGSVVSVPDAACTMTGGEQAVELKDTSRHYESMLGRWVEISGRLEGLERGDEPEDLRELHVRSFREVPVVPPQIAEAPRFEPPSPIEPPPPVPQAQAPAVSEEQPVATTGTAPAPPSLPKTASQSSLIGLLGLLSLAGAFGIRLFQGQHAR